MVPHDILMRYSREVVDFSVDFGLVILRSELDFLSGSAKGRNREQRRTDGICTTVQLVSCLNDFSESSFALYVSQRIGPTREIGSPETRPLRNPPGTGTAEMNATG
jgi:hypothetical protein